MTTKFFGVDIGGEVAAAAGPSDLPNFVFTKNSVNYTVWGSITEYKNDDISEVNIKGSFRRTQVQKGDKKVILIAKPLEDAGVEVEMSDTLTANGRVYNIVDAWKDGASAAWHLTCRG